MSQCVPTWEVDDGPLSAVAATKSRSSLPSPVNSAAADIPMLDYEVAELAWENGQLVLHGLGPPRVATKSPPSFSPSPWDKQTAGGTLESIVNQATMRLPNPNYNKPGRDADKPIPLFDHHRFPSCSATPAGGSTTVTMDALVPCSNHQEHLQNERVMTDTVPGLGVECLTRVGSCSGPLAGPGQGDEEALVAAKRARVAARGPAAEWSVIGSATGGRDHSRRVTTMDTYEMDVGMGFTSTSNGSPANTTSSGKPFTKTATADDHDSVCHSRPQRDVGDAADKERVAGKSSVSTKRSRAAAIHNQSERKRRDKINQRMKTLQKLVPNSSKTDKASMLEEAIEYLKQLQAQVNMMTRFNMPSAMMLPMAAMQQHHHQQQQQLQMSMLANPMGLGIGMGIGLGHHAMDRPATATTTIPNINAHNMMINPFTLMMNNIPQSWDMNNINGGSNDVRSQLSPMLDPMAAFPPMSMDAYSRMAAAMYQQMHQQPPQQSSNSKC